ncbi:MAG: UvrD-helicase domain-containing protein [Bacteroidales bacterium]|nr:UvrD-helicase domain-containing protein [Bacteroidales bacterium]
MKQDILNDLNDEQRKAVEATEGPVMVIAGAGSGKTRVLTYRVAHLINKGVDPFNILALTFTNKAAREMKERNMKLVGSSEARNVWMGTFHSIFARILRKEGHRLGYPSNYSIYDTDDSKSLIKSIIKEQNLDPKMYTANHVLGRISGSKSNLISADEYLEDPEIQTQDKMAGKPMLGRLYKIYQNRCFKASAMDFDDLLFNFNLLLRDFPDALSKYQRQFKYILVDEYQDTNYAQYLIVKKLAANNENICVVGDDAQSIYGFRGANIQNILNLQRDYPELRTFKLEQNYRSTQMIVNAANSIILNNKDQIRKTIWTQNPNGNKISLFRATSDTEEGRMVANAIFELEMNEHLPHEAFAILYRTNAQSRSLEEALRKINIPYRIYGGLSFYKRKEVKDLLAYFRLVINPNDREALLRIINFPARGIGKTSLEKIVIAANEQNKSVWEIIENINSIPIDIAPRIKAKVHEFVIMIKSFRAELKIKNAYDLAKHISSSSGIMKELYQDKTPEGLSRFENLEELLNAIKDFTEKEREPTEDLVEIENRQDGVRTLDEFMQDVALLTDADTDDKDDTNKVSLMTVHMAKGLEFPYIFVTGMEENLFPSMQSLGARESLEEERRLFYVAITRGEKGVALSYAQNRYRWGNLEFTEPSRFLDEVDEQFLDMPMNASASKTSKSSDANVEALTGRETESPSVVKRKNLKKVTTTSAASSKGAPSEAELSIQAGMEVEHHKFGRGKVLSIEGTGSNKKATVFFNKIGQKNLLLRFAKLRILE